MDYIIIQLMAKRCLEKFKGMEIIEYANAHGLSLKNGIEKLYNEHVVRKGTDYEQQKRRQNG
jgi:hypothetical protein